MLASLAFLRQLHVPLPAFLACRLFARTFLSHLATKLVAGNPRRLRLVGSPTALLDRDRVKAVSDTSNRIRNRGRTDPVNESFAPKHAYTTSNNVLDRPVKRVPGDVAGHMTGPGRVRLRFEWWSRCVHGFAYRAAPVAAPPRPPSVGLVRSVDLREWPDFCAPQYSCFYVGDVGRD